MGAALYLTDLNSTDRFALSSVCDTRACHIYQTADPYRHAEPV